MKTSAKTLLAALAATVLGAGTGFSAQTILLDSDEAHADAAYERSARAMPTNRSDEDRQIGVSRRSTAAAEGDRAASRAIVPKRHGRAEVRPAEVER